MKPFYVGYLPEAPAELRRFLRPRLLGLVALGIALAATFVLAQRPFSDGMFEFGVVRTFEGWVQERPYAALRVARPSSGGASRYLLVSFGKFGAADAVRGLDGRRVQLDGSLIYRDGQTMIEIADGSLTEIGEAVAPSAAESDGGRVTLTGEIVDSKCFLGVMKPGASKPHRACASRCLSGGIPPVLLVRNDDGTARYYLLVGGDGRQLGREVLPWVAEAIEVTGELRHHDDLLELRAEPSEFRRIQR